MRVYMSKEEKQEKKRKREGEEEVGQNKARGVSGDGDNITNSVRLVLQIYTATARLHKGPALRFFVHMDDQSDDAILRVAVQDGRRNSNPVEHTAVLLYPFHAAIWSSSYYLNRCFRACLVYLQTGCALVSLTNQALFLCFAA
jgi:hypothetical protein